MITPEQVKSIEELLNIPEIDEEESQRQCLDAWYQISSHPFFKPALDSDEPLIEIMLRMLDDLV